MARVEADVRLRLMLRRLVLLLFAAPVVYAAWCLVIFVFVFEPFGLPVRNNDYGWLGRTPRGSKCIMDIGKVNYWECKDISVFTSHRIQCRLWLRANGLEPGQ